MRNFPSGLENPPLKQKKMGCEKHENQCISLSEHNRLLDAEKRWFSKDYLGKVDGIYEELVKLKLVNNHSDKLVLGRLQRYPRFELIRIILSQRKGLARYENYYNASKSFKEKQHLKKQIETLQMKSNMNNDERVKYLREEHKKQITKLKKIIRKLGKEVADFHSTETHNRDYGFGSEPRPSGKLASPTIP